jgi:hypothetical protein
MDKAPYDKISVLTDFIGQALRALENGCNLPIKDVMKAVEGKMIVQWLNTRVDFPKIDLSLILAYPEVIDFINEEFYDLSHDAELFGKKNGVHSLIYIASVVIQKYNPKTNYFHPNDQTDA